MFTTLWTNPIFRFLFFNINPVLIFLFISASPASAYKLPPCDFVKEPVNILDIDPGTKKIKLPYKICCDPVGSYPVDIWLLVTDKTKIRFSGEDWDATFEDLLNEDQSICYAFIPVDIFLATTITIDPEEPERYGDFEM